MTRGISHKKIFFPNGRNIKENKENKKKRQSLFSLRDDKSENVVQWLTKMYTLIKTTSIERKSATSNIHLLMILL